MTNSVVVPLPQGYQEAPTVPTLRIRVVATGDVGVDPLVVPQSVANDIASWAAVDPRVVYVLDLGDVRWETETLLRTLTAAAMELKGIADGEAVMVVSSSQPSVAELARMIASHLDAPFYVTDSPVNFSAAAPAGKLTLTEKETLDTLRDMGGRVTANAFASAASLEITAAGNRLSNLARRGYVTRVPRSRRDGDEFVSPAWFEQRA